jgi:hypothetical protein
MYHPEKKFIFVHPSKCAGTSVRNILRKEINSTHGGVYEPEPHWPLQIWVNHIKHTYNLTSFDKKEWFIFGMVRNPFDRVVSYHEHIIRHNNQNPESRFKEWVKTDLRNHHFAKEKTFMNMFKYNKEIVCDHFVRQENIKNDVKILMERLNIQDYKLPHIRHATKRKDNDYRSFYDEETKEIVYDCFKDDIEYFGYKFGE